MRTTNFVVVPVFLIVTTLVEAAERPVLVVPGFVGSISQELFCDNAIAIDDFQFWLRDELGLDRNVPQDFTIDPIIDTYDTLIAAIDNDSTMKAVPAPWDWRQSFDEATQNWLIPAIDQAKSELGVSRVSIVAHSAGGLLVRHYIQNLYRDDIAKVVFLGTPHRGVVDAYLLWEGGDATGPMVPWKEGGRVKKRVIDALLERLLGNMAEGCGCSPFSSDLDFIRNGCPESGLVGPMLGVRDLLPSFPYIKNAGRISQLKPLEEMCEQNPFLVNLEQNVGNLTAHGIPMKIFAGSTLKTMKSITVATVGGSDTCEGKWADGPPRNRNRDGKAGDGRVLLKSACPGSDLHPFDTIPCITQDEIYPGKKPAEHLPHGDLPDIFKEEVVSFLSGNGAPTIISFAADPSSVPVNGVSTISVQASDPDGDPLTYEWSVICGGTLSSDAGPEDKTFTAPSVASLCAVSILVTDPFGAADAAMVDIEVTPLADGDFSLTADPATITVDATLFFYSYSSLSAITVTPAGGYNGNVKLSATVTPTTPAGFLDVYTPNNEIGPSEYNGGTSFRTRVRTSAADPNKDLIFTVTLHGQDTLNPAIADDVDLTLILRKYDAGGGPQ